MVTTDGPFEIGTPAWQVSFQRRVRELDKPERSPNRGILPYFLIGSEFASGLVLVPLADEESLWISVTCHPSHVVRAETPDGDPINVSRLALSQDVVLLSLEFLCRRGQPHPIDCTTVRIARTSHGPPSVSLTVTVAVSGVETRLRVCLATPAVYSHLSGRPAPAPSTPSDAYGGWRLM